MSTSHACKYTPRHHFSFIISRDFIYLNLTPEDKETLLDKCIRIYDSSMTPNGISLPFRDVILIALNCEDQS